MLRTSRIKTMILSFGLSTMLSSMALAQAAAAAPTADPGPAGTKIGVVDLQAAIQNTNEGKKETDTLEAKFGGKQNELKTLNDEIERLKKEYQAQEKTLSDTAKTEKLKAIETKTKTLQRSADDFQSEVQQAEQEIIGRLGQKMLTVLDKYAKANGYAVVVDVSNPQTPVVFAAQANNITKQLIDTYNAESGVAAPKAGATTTRPAPAPTPKKP